MLSAFTPRHQFAIQKHILITIKSRVVAQARRRNDEMDKPEIKLNHSSPSFIFINSCIARSPS